MKNKEHALQASMVIEFSQEKPEERGCLIGYFAEVENGIQGSLKNSLGLVRGVSDLLYITKSGHLIGIEVKAPGSSHNVAHLREQAEWLIKVPVFGYFCDSKEQFWNIINYKSGGYTPKEVLNALKDVNTKTISWDKLVSLIK